MLNAIAPTAIRNPFRNVVPTTHEYDHLGRHEAIVTRNDTIQYGTNRDAEKINRKKGEFSDEMNLVLTIDPIVSC